ncbi:RNA-binding protein Cwf29 [Tilletia horrida]|uniref:RNA-binding protein Cwf29 n=1 Tax=Tilletia horrida TaxID=155126 RepID=A0AAN6GWX5_9BASI|nr:RNA-binding protein Cwf29 [Tilletia horrida]KAK0569349.1 RNA-binding protein Cwf29 [Tilletia horrida]
MNNVRAINKINEVELENALRSGTTGASWHDEYKDSAYIFVGGLPVELTEGDVITIFSQFGEIMDINLPREKDSGKRRGFGFLMYEDQRSTILAVDNLNGAEILGRTLRVDHVKQYKQKRERGDDGEWKDAEEQSLNAAPALTIKAGETGAGTASESYDTNEADPDLEDPMAAFFAQRRKEEKGKGESSSAHDREAEKEAKRQRKEERARKRARKEERRREKEERPSESRHSSRREESPPRGAERYRSGEDGRRRDHDSDRRRHHPEEQESSRRRYEDDRRHQDRDLDRHRYGATSDRAHRAGSSSRRPGEDEGRHGSHHARERDRGSDRLGARDRY